MKHQRGNYLRRDLATISPYVWVLALVVLLLASVACGLWAIYALRLQQPLPGPSPTAVIWTATPEPTAQASPTPTEPPVATPTISPEIAIGRYVRVTGTEGVGVSLREQPDVNSARMAIGQEGSVLAVLDGPRQIGGYTWWLVHDPEDEERRGWAVANFLQPIDRP
jgi:hypothetical protein